MKVCKFGGTSVGTPESIKKVIEIVRDAATRESCAVVVSAFTNVTDQLIALCEAATRGDEYQGSLQELERRHFEVVRELISPTDQSVLLTQIKALCNELADILRGLSLLGELTPRAKDLVMSFGERLSATVIVAALNGSGCPALLLDARECIKTDADYGHANVLIAETNRLVQNFFSKSQPLTVVTGFIASTVDGHTTTLGRGGSDYTASILGAALDASGVEIWTDVDGIMSADPRNVSQARYVMQMTYEEAMELSFFGAKVLYYPTVTPARERHIPLLIKNTFNPDAPGTLISDQEQSQSVPVTAITSIGAIALLQVRGTGLVGKTGMACRVFEALSAKGVNIILISQGSSQYSICVAIRSCDAPASVAGIEESFELEIERKKIERPYVEDGGAIIAVVGIHMRENPGIAGRIFSAVGRRNINVRAIAQGSSELNVSFVVADDEKEEAIRVIHEEFFV